LDPRARKNYFNFLFCVKEKLTNMLTVENRKDCWSVVIISADNEEEIRPEGNPNQVLPK